MTLDELFRADADHPHIGKTCRTCKHRQRWQCGGSVIQYCGKRKSKRTFNHLLKIKVTNEACCFYEEVEE